MTSSTPSTLPEGDIEFFDNVIPALKDGDYTITATPTLEGTGIQGADLIPKTQQFSVQGARFTLNTTADIQTYYPPDKSRGQFEEKLPHIVLTKRTLPWERKLSSKAPDGTPWVALLLFDENEILPPSSKTSPTKASSRPLKEILQPGKGILGPDIKLEFGQTEEMVCQAIDISTETFKNIVPHSEELPYLTHVRQVNVANKSIMDMCHSGWFSVVVGNRFPNKHPTAPVKQICHLVSLEGFDVDNPDFSGITTVRLVSLASWSFTCMPQDEETFSALMQSLVEGKTASDLLFKLPLKKAPTPEQKSVGDAINCGFVPLTYLTRPGDQTFAWYRGPFSPVLSARFTEKISPFDAPSQAIIYDEKTGIFNHSYAIAMQTGRSLALADSTFATNLLNWRRQANRLVDLCFSRLKADGIDLEKNADAVHTWLDEQFLSKQFLDYLLTDFSDKIAPKMGSKYTPVKPGVKESTSPPPDPSFTTQSLPTSLVQEFEKFLSQENVKLIVQQMATDEFAQIIEWLSRLYLLYDLPVNTLIPDSNLLPKESIRFFYLDRAWLDSLVMGALSVGIHTSKDSLYYKLTKDIIFEGVESLVLETRQKLLGLSIDPQKDPTKGNLAGFVFRSQVVQNWPGLEIKAYKTSALPEPSDSIPLLRMDRLSPSLLLCLFPEVPAWIEFNEPKEGLCFGVEVDGKAEELIQRDTTGHETGTYSIQPSDYRPNSNNRVFDITQLHGHLGTNLSPASFALQMVHVPEQMVFQNKTLK